LKAPGLDNVPNLLIKRGGPVLQLHLRRLYNLSLAIGYVPSSWKVAVVVPLPREGKDLSSPNGYRPVSLLPTVAKLLESIMAKRLLKDLERAKLLPDHQSGFRALRSCDDQLFRLSEVVSKGFARGKVTVTAFVDFQGAFNAVWHDGLRSLLAKSPLVRAKVRWLSSFLGDRRFLVRVGQALSQTYEAKAGVPQGSALSPILFVLFTASMLPDDRARRPEKGSFADDVMLMASDKSEAVASQLVQMGLRRVEQWSADWKLPLNPTKCVALTFSHRRRRPDPPKLWLDGTRLTAVDSTKYLGVTFDRKLNFRQHFTNVKTTAMKRLNALRRLRGRDLGFSRASSLLVYKQLIRSVIEWGAPAFLGRATLKTGLAALQKIQNACLRTALRVCPRTRIVELHQLAGIEPIRQRLLESARRFIVRARKQVVSIRVLVREHLLSRLRNRGPLTAIMPMS
jgi:hypothetical protein